MHQILWASLVSCSGAAPCKRCRRTRSGQIRPCSNSYRHGVRMGNSTYGDILAVCPQRQHYTVSLQDARESWALYITKWISAYKAPVGGTDRGCQNRLSVTICIAWLSMACQRMPLRAQWVCVCVCLCVRVQCAVCEQLAESPCEQTCSQLVEQVCACSVCKNSVIIFVGNKCWHL